jgi:hypothetical protein
MRTPLPLAIGSSGELLALARALKWEAAMQASAHTARNVPEDFNAEAARSATLSPYVALAIAVRNE